METLEKTTTNAEEVTINKKLLSICSIYPSKATGSFGEFLLGLTKELKEYGIAHTIAFPLELQHTEHSDIITKKLEESGAEIKIIHETPRDIKKTLEFIRLVKEVKPSLIHMHFYRAYSLFNIYISYRDIPLLYSEHLLPSKRSLLWRIFRNILHQINAKILNVGVTKIICVSDFVREEHARHYGVSKKKLITIYNGINLDRFKRADADSTRALRKELGLAADIPVITCVSVIRNGKGIEHFVAAAPIVLNKIKNVKFLIVGDGPRLLQIKEMVRELDMEMSFVFMGHRSDVERILSMSNVLVVPTASTWPEPFGFVAAEGMGVGVPVVASDIGGLRSIVEDGKTGFLVSPDNPAELANKIIEIITDNALAMNFSINGTERAKNLFSLERTVHEHIQLYLYSIKQKKV